MLNVSKLKETDLSAIDVRTLTGAEWEAVKREVERRARAERAHVVGAVFKWLGSWWLRRNQLGDPAIQTHQATQMRPFSFGRP